MKRKIVVVAGFQGVNKDGDVTTLGRGGSDTSAVALAAALEENVRFIRMLTEFIRLIRECIAMRKNCHIFLMMK